VQNNDLLRTKDDYKDAIEAAIDQRRIAMAQLTKMTLNEFDEKELLAVAHDALASIELARHYRELMKEAFPPTCSCNCHDTP
jgi:hypothetical protein